MNAWWSGFCFAMAAWAIADKNALHAAVFAVLAVGFVWLAVTQ